jgi:hypothetical protein
LSTRVPTVVASDGWIARKCGRPARSCSSAIRAERIAGERLPEEAKTAGEPRGFIVFKDHTQIHFNLAPVKRDDNHYPEMRQGNELVDAVEPADRTLGLILADSDWGASELLALLVEQGKITLADVDALSKHSLTPHLTDDDWQESDAVYTAFHKKHGL